MKDTGISKDVLNFQHESEIGSATSEMIDAMTGAATITGEYATERDELNRIFGQVQMAQAIRNFTDVISLSKLSEIKKSKSYRQFKGIIAHDKHGKIIPNVGTWEGFCKALKTSCQKVDEDLANLDVFGESSLESLQDLGIGYRELRKLKKLPEEGREAAISVAVENGDKTQVIELIEEQALLHAKEKAALAQEKEELAKQLERVQSDHTANQRLLEDKDRKINELDRELKRDLTPDESIHRRNERDTELQKQLNDKTLACLATLNEMGEVVEQIFSVNDRSDHLDESLYGEMRAVFRHALLMGRKHQIDPIQLLGFAVDHEKLDKVLEGELV